MTREQSTFLTAFRDFAGDALRDVWVFDETDLHCLYIREDVAASLEDHDPARYIDNERYGFITRRTYENLTYASQQYTVRGFTEFTQFRTFLPRSERDGVFGVLASLDPEPYDFQSLYDALCGADRARYAYTGLTEGRDAYELADD
jgi:hypothetical protein